MTHALSDAYRPVPSGRLFFGEHICLEPSVALDGKSVIEGSHVRESRPWQYLTDLLHDRVAAPMHKPQYLTVPNTRALIGPENQHTAGNERADTEAKLAATGDSSSTTLLPPALGRHS